MNLTDLGNAFSQNFGGYIFGLIVIILVYSAVGIWAPQYSAAFAMITVLGIVLYRMNKK